MALLRAKMGTKIVKKISSKLNWRLHFANIRILNSVPFQFSPVRDLHQPNKTLRCELTEYSVSTWYCFIYHAVLQSRTADVITAPTVSNLVIIYTLESVLFVRAKHTHTFCTSNLNNDSFTFRDQKDKWSVGVRVRFAGRLRYQVVFSVRKPESATVEAEITYRINIWFIYNPGLLCFRLLEVDNGCIGWPIRFNFCFTQWSTNT